MVLAAISVAAGAALYLAPGPAARNGSATTVVLPPGSRLPTMAGQLGAAGVIRSPLAFMVAAELSGVAHRLQAGEYAFSSGSSLSAMLSDMRHGRVVRHFVTIPEGLTSAQAVAILTQAPELTGEVATPPEGSLLPETYEVARGEARSVVLARMRAARDALLSRLWSNRDNGLGYRSPQEAVILASVVEKETALAGERPHVAAVFLNRLKRGMALGSDPTVIYGLTGGAPLGHGLRVSELARTTPYNTYHLAGLPPTPIDNPGRAALEAVFHPTPGDDLYFVADGTGGHVFSASLAQHLKNVAHWRAIELARASEGGGRPSAR
ncbi:MAG TPA: endolytic transglycosylase MltG [Caulobacteraceae bacterium]